MPLVCRWCAAGVLVCWCAATGVLVCWLLLLVCWLLLCCCYAAAAVKSSACLLPSSAIFQLVVSSCPLTAVGQVQRQLHHAAPLIERRIKWIQRGAFHLHSAEHNLHSAQHHLLPSLPAAVLTLWCCLPFLVDQCCEGVCQLLRLRVGLDGQELAEC